jgi:hypothetical protein
MQSSGSISIGQARNECQLSGQIDAANYRLSHLAGVNQGNAYAWSYWYGKSYVTNIVNQQFAVCAAHVDRDLYLNINFRTGATSWTANGNNNPNLMWYTQTYPNVTLAQYYTAWNATVLYQAGDTGVALSVSQQPSPSNDFTAIIHFDDNPASGAHDVQVGINITFTS